MAEAKATLSNYRQSPRKVRIVADMVRGKKVEDAIITLSFVAKRSSEPLKKLLESAVANAKNLSIPLENLVVKEIAVDGGKILYRRLPMSRGRAFVMRKRTSHVNIVLAEVIPKVKKSKKTK
ncbi:MAG: ribosomal protein large subunit ribosomal protein [Parcubacteria group bacterium]|jgi:large subunit ribosomal protein L22|nr:ribosomal protein large subunit ribosomal protein [Parcubacteria group bacterium]